MSDHMESQMQDMMERGEAWFDAICDMLDKHGFDVSNMLDSDILKHASFLETINNKDREIAQVKIENEELRVFIEGCSEIHDYKTIMKDAIVVRGNIWECMKKQTSEASLFFSWLVEIAHHKPEHWRFKSAIKAFLDYKEKRGE